LIKSAFVFKKYTNLQAGTIYNVYGVLSKMLTVFTNVFGLVYYKNFNFFLRNNKLKGSS